MSVRERPWSCCDWQNCITWIIGLLSWMSVMSSSMSSSTSMTPCMSVIVSLIFACRDWTRWVCLCVSAFSAIRLKMIVCSELLLCFNPSLLFSHAELING